MTWAITTHQLHELFSGARPGSEPYFARMLPEPLRGDAVRAYVASSKGTDPFHLEYVRPADAMQRWAWTFGDPQPFAKSVKVVELSWTLAELRGESRLGAIDAAKTHLAAYPELVRAVACELVRLSRRGGTSDADLDAYADQLC